MWLEVAEKDRKIDATGFQKSLEGAECFLTLLDDNTFYTWVYALKTKHVVFQCFKKWQVEVENFTDHRVKGFRTDNGGEFTSQAHLKACGIHHELTYPKLQNRMESLSASTTP